MAGDDVERARRGAARPGPASPTCDRRRVADAVAVQEIRRRQARRLADRLGWHHEWVFKHNGYWPLWWRAEGLAILSPSPLDDVWRECLSDRRQPAQPPPPRRDRRHGAARRWRRSAPRRHPPRHEPTRGADSPRGPAARRARRRGARPLVVAGDLNARDEIELIHTLRPGRPRRPRRRRHQPGRGARCSGSTTSSCPTEAEVTQRWTPDGGPPWAALSDHLPTLVEQRHGQIRSQ